MWKSLSDKFADLAGRFYDRGSGWAGRLRNLVRWLRLSAWLIRRLSKPAALVGIEFFAALSLAVYFFFLVGPQAEAPRSYDGNEMNTYLFTYLSEHPYPTPPHKNLVADFDNWKARLAGPLITGWMHDAALKIFAKKSAQSSFDSEKVHFGGYYFLMSEVIFGFYHALWLFLLFVVLILHRRDALLIMLGIFSGLMYNFILPAGRWFCPWDMPTMFFFTWACLLYDQRQFVPLMVVVWLGSLFKETTLCCALLVFLGEHWTLKKRIAGFMALAIVCLLTRRWLMAMCGIKTMFFALNNAGNFHELIHKTWCVLYGNIHLLFSLDLNHVLFANAGALFIMMMIPWRNRRDVVFKILALAFIIGQFLCGIINEFRIWYELLPMGWMVISETLSNRFPMILGGQGLPGLSSSDLVADNQASRVMKGSYWLMIVFVSLMMFVVLAILTLALLIMKY